jgi:hypothetical protein
MLDVEGTVAAYLLTRIMARIICTLICGGEAKKSSKWFLQTLTLQPGTVFPVTSARFFVRPRCSRWSRSLAGGHVAAYFLTRIMARIICTVICGKEGQKKNVPKENKRLRMRHTNGM